MCREGRGLGSKLVSFTKGFLKHPHILAIFKVDSECLRFPFKSKVDYFILHSILVYSFLTYLIFFCYEQKKTHERSVSAKLVSFAKGFSKHPYVLAMFKVDSECLRFPFKSKVDYFILHSILVYIFLTYLIFFCYEQKKTHERSVSAKLVSFAKGFSKHPYVLAMFKVDSECLRFPFKSKVDYFILHSILVYSFVTFLIFFAVNKRRRTDEASLLN